MNQTFNVPLLPDSRVRVVLKDAGLSLSQARTRAFVGRLNTALANYAVAQILASIDGVPPYKRIRKLKRIEAAARRTGGDAKLQRFIDGTGDEVAAAASRDFHRVALSRGVQPDSLLADRVRLANFAHSAWQRLQVRMNHVAAHRIKPGQKREARHQGDRAMQQFFGTMNELWLRYFRRLPGVTGRTKPSKKRAALGDKTKPPRGQYVVLIREALYAYAREVNDDLECRVPGLRKRLRLESNEVHGYFRRTGISKLKHF